MPWQVKGCVEQRLDFVRRALKGEGLSGLCREYGISRPTGYLWLDRFKSSGEIVSLLDRSHRPATSPLKTSREVEERVVELRNQYGWGADKLKILLKQRHNLDVSRITINRIISRHGLLIEDYCNRPALKRFERSRSNELWQVDLKGCMGRGAARCEPLSILDDHSRYLTGLYPTKTSKLIPIKQCFLETFNKYGVPESLLMDHGVPWWNPSNFLGLTRLSVWLMNQDIKLIFSGYNHPQTQGKVERFHKTLKQAVLHLGTPIYFADWMPLLKTIRRDYNEVRPHESLKMRVPSSVYKPSSKPFNPKPKLPEYPDNSTVVKLDSHGMFRFNKKRLFVCQALAEQFVRIEVLENSILVFYRATPLREINLRTSSSSQFRYLSN